MQVPVSNSKFTFGLYDVDLQTGQLRKAGFRVKLQSQPFKVLAALLERPGQVVTREELQLRLWGKDTVVDFDHSLGTAINKIREALGDSAENPRFIETLARRGYRFIAPVSIDEERAISTQLPAGPGAVLGSVSTGVHAGVPQGVAPREPDREKPLPEPVTSPGSPAGVPVPATRVFPSQMRSSPRLLWLAAVLAITAIAGAYFAGARHPRPAPAHISQITHNGHLAASVVSMESLAAAATDGVHIYATELENGRAQLADVALPDGDVSTLSVPAEVAAPTLGDISPDGSRLLLRDHLSPESEQPLWVVPTGGGSALRVGNVLAHDATWMPQGNAVLYATGNQLFSIDLDGGSPRDYATLPGRAFWLRWAPKAGLLRFTIIDPLRHTLALWQLSAEDRKPVPLLSHFTEPSSECCGVWTADGRWFIFQSSEAGHTDLWRLKGTEKDAAERITDGPLQFEAPLTARSGDRVYFLGVDARSELQRVTTSGELAPITGFLAKAVRMEYSRDGRLILWTDSSGHLWRARSDGTEQLQLTPTGLDVFLARWSPDASEVALMAREPGHAWQLYLVSANGENLRPMLKEIRNAADPSWAPDGKDLVFGRTNDRMGDEGSRLLEFLDLKSGSTRPVPRSEGLFSPRWSPDGQYIAALSLDQRKVELFDVANQTWATLPVASGADPVWSADSKFLFVHASMDPEQPILRVRVTDRQVTQLLSLGRASETNAVDFVLSGLSQDGMPLIRTRTFTGDLFSLDLGS